MLEVKTMSKNDFPFAVTITKKMNWGLSEGDFEFASELEPDGCFVLVDDSEKIGLATTISFGRVAWFGNLIVDEAKRNKGAGSKLVTHALEYLRSKNVETVGLYAYKERIHFYERLGFKSDSEFVVLKGNSFKTSLKANVEQVKNQDLEKLMEFDQSCFGAPRSKMLEPVIQDTDNLCLTMREEDKYVGYCVAKRYQDKAEIGPLVSKRRDVALELLKSVLNRLVGVESTLFMPRRESAISSFLVEKGFCESFRVQRMFFGSPVNDNCLYLAESLERG